MLHDNAAVWREQLKQAKTPKARDKAEAKYRHRQIKDSLVAACFGKCAYCESRLRHIDYGHIDHFVPKRGLRGRSVLVFSWSNLILACGVCNGPEYKGARFPLRREGGPLINPFKDQPSDHFDFVFDTKAGLASVYGKTTRGQTTEVVLGLNRQELRRHRSQFMKKILLLVEFAASKPEAADLLDQATMDCAEYAAFVRAVWPSRPARAESRSAAK